MNQNYFDNIINQCLWTYVSSYYSDVIKYICPDHTFGWAPQGYLIVVHIYQKIPVIKFQQIKSQLTNFIVRITGLEPSTVKILIYQNSRSNNTL
jgi:hypothetical protein